MEKSNLVVGLAYIYTLFISQNVDYSLIILFFILSLLIYVKLNKIVRKMS